MGQPHLDNGVRHLVSYSCRRVFVFQSRTQNGAGGTHNKVKDHHCVEFLAKTIGALCHRTNLWIGFFCCP